MTSLRRGRRAVSKSISAVARRQWWYFAAAAAAAAAITTLSVMRIETQSRGGKGFEGVEKCIGNEKRRKYGAVDALVDERWMLRGLKLVANIYLQCNLSG